MGTRLGGGERYSYIRDHLPPSNASDNLTGLGAWAPGQAVADKVYKPWVQAGHWSKRILHRGGLRVVCSAAIQVLSTNAPTLDLTAFPQRLPSSSGNDSHSDMWRLHPSTSGIVATAEGLPISIGGSMLVVIHHARNKRSS